jgi:hypothetical protein
VRPIITASQPVRVPVGEHLLSAHPHGQAERAGRNRYGQQVIGAHGKSVVNFPAVPEVFPSASVVVIKVYIP